MAAFCIAVARESRSSGGETPQVLHPAVCGLVERLKLIQETAAKVFQELALHSLMSIESATRCASAVEPIGLKKVVLEELEVQIEWLLYLQDLVEEACKKYPLIAKALKEDTELASQFAKIYVQTKLMTSSSFCKPHAESPKILAGELRSRFTVVQRVLTDLCKGSYSEEGALFFFKKALAKFQTMPATNELTSHIALRALKELFLVDYQEGTLKPADERQYKDIFIIGNPEGSVRAKFKPMAEDRVRREVYASIYDRIAGIDMTPPICRTKLRDALNKIKEVRGHLAKGTYNSLVAALELFNALPLFLQYRVFSVTYDLLGEGRDEFGLGEKLWKGMTLSRTDRIRIIDKVIESEFFEGSLQRWITGTCFRAYDLLTWEDGAEKLMTIPRHLVHFHVLSALVKGSTDNSSGNTMFVFADDYSRIIDIKEFDDEGCMPEESSFRELRIWQLGLPQANEPFDRATLELFADERWVKAISRFNRFAIGLSDDSLLNQMRRLESIRNICIRELEKAQITFTPRELFFEICGGKEEYTKLLTEGKSPWEIFDRDLNEQNYEIPFVPVEADLPKVSRTLARLYPK